MCGEEREGKRQVKSVASHEGSVRHVITHKMTKSPTTEKLLSIHTQTLHIIPLTITKPLSQYVFTSSRETLRTVLPHTHTCTHLLGNRPHMFER